MARSRGCDAILAGHVHLAGIEGHDDVLYCNSGDWVESCTAIVEWSGLVPELPPAAASLSIDRPESETVPGVAACARSLESRPVELILGKDLTGRPLSRSATMAEGLARRVSGTLTPPLCAAAAAVAAAADAGGASAWGWAALLIAVGVLLPTGYVFFLLRSGRISDLHMPVREERRRPLAGAVVASAAALGLLWAGGAPPLMVLVAAVQTAQALLFLGVTLRWKISAHCAGYTGLAVACCWLFGADALPALTLVPLVAWSRVFLRRHTLGQTLAGTAAGCSLWLLALAGLPAL